MHRCQLGMRSRRLVVQVSEHHLGEEACKGALTGTVGGAVADDGAVVGAPFTADLLRAVANTEAEVCVAAGAPCEVVRVAAEVRHGDLQHVAEARNLVGSDLNGAREGGSLDACLPALWETGWGLGAHGQDAGGDERERSHHGCRCWSMMD